MDVAIAGAGSIGSVLGIYLASQGHQVELLRRNKQQGEYELRCTGELELNQKMKVFETSSDHKPREIDVIFITTQIQQNNSIIEYIKSNYLISNSTIFALFQNGLYAHRELLTAFSNSSIIQGLIWWSATQIDDTVVYYHRSAPTYIGLLMGQDRTSIVKELLEPQFETHIVEDITSEVRKKVLLNVVSPVLALIKQPYPQGLNNFYARRLVHALFDEAMDIAMLKNWEIDDEKLTQFHHLISTSDHIKIPPTQFIHKVSTQISAEKHGGKGSNTSKLLEFFANEGGSIAQIIINSVNKLQPGYDPIPERDLEKLLSKIEPFTKDCKTI